MKRLAPRHLPQLATPRGGRRPEVQLRMFRKARRLTVSQLAALCGVRRETLHRVESGAQNPSPSLQRLVSHHLGLTSEEEVLAFGLPGRGTFGSFDTDRVVDGANAAGIPRLMRIERSGRAERPHGGDPR